MRDLPRRFRLKTDGLDENISPRYQNEQFHAIIFRAVSHNAMKHDLVSLCILAMVSWCTQATGSTNGRMPVTLHRGPSVPSPPHSMQQLFDSAPRHSPPRLAGSSDDLVMLAGCWKAIDMSKKAPERLQSLPAVVEGIRQLPRVRLALA